ncbi:hypothetical protein BH10ACT7_BH10ACT7_22790 [soil metagenome]
MAKKAAAEAPPEEIPVPPDGSRFFTWMRSLGIVREPGWIGGVCAGVAARLGIDPLIVRGIVVVVAVLGGPAFLLYAAAWLLLPDINNKIHLEELIAGRFESPIAGIGVLVVLSLLPITQGFWYAGAAYWGTPEWGSSIGRVLWTVALLASAIWFVVWVARRSGRPAPLTDAPAAATPKNPGSSKHHGARRATSAAFVVAPPTHPAPGAPEAEVAEWREQQAAWRAEREAFRLERAATEQETRRLRAEEAHDRALAASAERAESHRLYMLANPHAGAAFGAIAIGAAAVAGGVAAVLASGEPEQADHRLTIGLAVASLVLAAGIIIAGVWGRRAGFLNFVALLVIAATFATAVLPRDRQLIPPFTSYGLSNAVAGNYLALAGNLDITIDKSLPLDGGVIDVWQATGSTTIWLGEGTTTRVEIVSGTGDVTTGWRGDGITTYGSVEGQTLTDEHWRSTTTFGTGTEPDVTIRIWQERGSISILQPNELEDQG